MAKSTNPNQVAKLYQTVIDDVIANIREAFLDDGVDEQVLQELKQTWEAKVVQSKAVQTQADDARHGQASAMPMYVYANTAGGGDGLPRQVVYRTIPGGQGIQMTGAGQQAAMALPGNIVYQQQPLASTSANQGQLYASYQPNTHQNAGQSKVVLATPNPVPTSASANKSAQQSVTQLDGASDSKPCTSKLCNQKKNSKVLSKQKPRKIKFIAQLDGNVGSSSEDDDDDDDDEDDDDDAEEYDEDEKAEKEPAVDEEPLCSADDGSDEDPEELFDTDNVVVCQYDKIHRTKARWKFNLKVGIMNLDGKDLVFQRATGEAEW